MSESKILTETGDTIEVLHVDDEPEFADLTATFLERENDRFTVETATSADDGLEIINDRPPDCVVSDYNMPGMDGLEFLQAVREDNPDLPFILFTGKGSEEVASDAISTGATDYLQKRSGSDQYSLLANRILNAVRQNQSEKRLSETRKEYTTVFENAQNALLLVDVEDDGFRYQQCNPRATEFIGRDRTEIVGKSPREALGPENGRKVVGAYRKCIHQRESVAYTVTLDLPVGQVVRDCEVTPVSSNGEIEKLVVDFRDVTDQRERQRALEKVETLFEHAQDSLFLIDVTDEFVIERVNPAYEDGTGVSASEIRGQTPKQLLGEEQGTAIEARYRECVERREPLQYTEQLQFGADPSYWETRIAPVVVEDTVEYIAGSTRNITGQRERQQELQEERRFITQAFDALDDLFYVLDVDGSLRRWNSRVVDVTGYAEAELDDMQAVELFPEDDREKIADAIQMAVSGETVTVEADLRTVDGRRIPYEFTGARLTDENGTTTGIVGTGRDLTERKQRDRRFRALVEESNDVISIVDADGRFQYQSPSLERILGHDPEATVGDTAWEYIHPDDRETVIDEFETWVANPDQRGETVEYRARDADGSWRWMEAEGNSQLDNPAVEGYVVNSRDITERKKRRQELEEYETIIEALTDAAYVLDEEGRFTYVNDEFVELVGYDRGTILGNAPSLIKDEEAVERAEQELGRLLSSDGPATVTFEVTVQPRDGDPIVCEDHMGVLPYQGDRFEGSVGTLRDVTERKEREQELQELKSQYETLAENFPEGAVYLIDTDLQCVRAGGKELSKVGLSPDDVEGKKPHALFPEEIADELCHYYEEALNGNANTFEQEYEGERYRIQTVPVRIEGEETEYVMAVSKNVTECTENRERLRRRDEQLSRLHDATRDLFGADSPEQAAEIASRAADDILGLPVNGIHFYDDTADGLVPVAVSDRSREVLGEVPVIDDGIALETFQDGEFQMYTDVRDASNVYNPETPIRSEMYIPIGSHGIFIISSRQVDAFADADVEFARTLAANTTAALERISRQEELQTRKKELLRRNERLGEFASVVSHDLRSPLRVADGHIDLAKQECDSDHLTRAAEAIDRSQALIDDLLTLAREGDAVTGSESVALVDVAQDSWETVETRRATLESDATGRIEADRSRLRQLFENLYRNAVEHGGDEVTVHIGDLDGGFYVADTGPGIPESDRDEIFEAGYSTADHGTGFGLRIVEQIVEAHGWEISVTESAQGGARFEVTGVEKAD